MAPAADARAPNTGNRDLHLVRLEDDADMGFTVEEHGRNRFAVAAVRPNTPAARAGIAPGHVLMSIKLHPMGMWREEEQVVSHREFQAWDAESLAELNARPTGRAVVAKVNSPDGFSTASDRRHQAVLKAKHLIRTDQEHHVWEQPARFDAFLVGYDTQLRAGNEEPSVPATESGRGSRGKRRAPGGHAKATGWSKRRTLSHDSTHRNFGNRDLHIVRLSKETHPDGEDEPDMGFAVEDDGSNQFVVSFVRPGSAAARAGMAIGQRVTSYKLFPWGEWNGEEQVGNYRLYSIWDVSSLAVVNSHPPNRVCIVKVNATGDLSREGKARVDEIKRLKHAISCDKNVQPWERQGRLDEVAVAVDTRCLKRNSESVDAKSESENIDVSDDDSQASGEQSTAEHARGPSATASSGDTPRPSSPGIAEEFIQPGGDPVVLSLTRASLRSLERDDTEMTPEIVALLCAKMAQFVRSSRLRVLHPRFYTVSVLPSVAEAWREFAGPDPPIVCLPVFDIETDRWVLVAVVSKDDMAIVYYLDCKNPYGYVDGAGKKVAAYLESAYAELAQSPRRSVPVVVRKVVQRGVELTPVLDENSCSSGIHLLSYYATIVRLLDSNQEDADFAWLIGKAMYGYILPRSHLLSEVQDVFAHVLDPKLCWGRSESTGWWPCRRLSLRKETVAPPPLKDEVTSTEPDQVPVVWLNREAGGIEWLPSSHIKPLDEMTVDAVLRQCDASMSESASVTLEAALTLRAAYKSALASGRV